MPVPSIITPEVQKTRGTSIMERYNREVAELQDILVRGVLDSIVEEDSRKVG
jgi:hypothetical protein